MRPPLASFEVNDLEHCALLDVICKDAFGSESMPKTESIHHFLDESSDYRVEDCQYLNDSSLQEYSSRVLVFATTLKGHSVAMSVTGQCPSVTFEMKSPSDVDIVKRLMGPMFSRAHIRLIERKRFYGQVPDKKNPTQAAVFQQAEVQLPSFHACTLLKRRLLNLKQEVVNQALKPETAFCNDLGLIMSGWSTVDVSKEFRVRTQDEPGWSTCQIELDLDVSALKPIEFSALPPWIAISFDCEMMSFDGTFPSVSKSDQTSCLCATVWSTNQDRASEKHAFYVDHSDGTLLSGLQIQEDLKGLVLHPCLDSANLIETFRDFIVDVDADILTGWNIYGFDMPFLFQDWSSYFLATTERGSQGFVQKLWSYVNPGLSRPTSQDLMNSVRRSCSLTVLQDILKKYKISTLPKNFADWPESDAFEIRKALAAAAHLDSSEWNPGKSPTKADLERFSKDPLIEEEDRALASRFLRMQSRGELQTRGLQWNRIRTMPSSLEIRQMTSAAKGDNTQSIWTCLGRVTVDLMQIIKDDKKPESNSLRFAAETFLDASLLKKDLSAQEMFDNFKSQEVSKMSILLDYCIRDAEIPMKLIQKLSYMSTWIEMSRVTFTSLSQVLNGGQQRKVFNVIARFVHGEYVINKRPSGWPIEADLDNLDEDFDPLAKRKPDQQGATVIEPEPGHYETPVSVLDFESLYPSIIIFFNLCASSLVLDSLSEDVLSHANFVVESHNIDHNILVNAKDMIYKTETRQYSFVKHVAGVMPRLLRHLLKSRKSVKALMASEKDPFMKAVLNGRQNGLKIVCNSVYGFCGVSASKGLLPCKPVAAVTTLKGRSFIDAAKNQVESKQKGSKVLYGDTDSIMIKWHAHESGRFFTIPEAQDLGEMASKEITSLLRSGLALNVTMPVLEDARTAVTLANEKVQCPYLLIKKKNQAGIKWTPSKTAGPDSKVPGFGFELDMKGIDAVRRDRTKMVRDLSETLLNVLLIENNAEASLKVLEARIHDILEDRVSVDDFTLSKSLKGTQASENVPHVQAWRRMKARGDPGCPEKGGRMPIVIVDPQGPQSKLPASKVPLYLRAEHPDFVKKSEGSIRLCKSQYLEGLQETIERLQGPTRWLPNVKAIFENALERASFQASKSATLRTMFGESSVETFHEVKHREEPKGKRRKQETIQSFSLMSTK